MKKSLGIFWKTFIYTMVLLCLVLSVLTAIFAKQFVSYYKNNYEKQITASVIPIIEKLKETDKQNAIDSAENFEKEHKNINIFLVSFTGQTLYNTSKNMNFSITDGKIHIKNLSVNESGKNNISELKMHTATVSLDDEKYFLVFTYECLEKNSYKAFF